MGRGLRHLGRLALAIIALAASVSGVAQEAADDRPLVLTTPVEGAIGPPTARHIGDAIETAEDRGAALLVLTMDTPGGLTSSTRDINRDILSADVPVAVYVTPSGARAASAGTYILYASHVAGMAPGTNLGAATPVQMGGGAPGGGSDDSEDQSATGAKAINDAAASIRSLAELRDRNADWAESAVREAASLTASEALDRDVIEIVAPDTAAFVAAADGRTVSLGDREVTLSLADARIETIDVSLVTQLLSILANPNVALLLMTLGFYGLVYELAAPGLGPGIAGAVLLVLGLYSLNTLPVNYAGAALILLGLGLMAAEAVSPSFGILGIGGAIAFVIGAAILIDSDAAAFSISWGVVGTLLVLSGGVLVWLFRIAWRTTHTPAVASSGVMAGVEAVVLSWDGGSGQVRAQGERWQAEGPDRLSPGDHATVERAEGLTLHLGAEAPPKEDT